MKRKLVTATMAAMMMVSSAVPAMAMVGARKPESPDRMVITSIRHNVEEHQQRKEPVPMKETRVAPVAEPVLYEKVPNVQEGDKWWYLAQPTQQKKINYTVQKGDTLWKLAQKKLQTEDVKQIRDMVQYIVQINQLENPDLILTGDQLHLPG